MSGKRSRGRVDTMRVTPRRDAQGRPVTTITQAQDHTARGDGGRPDGGPRILVGVKMPVDLKSDLKAAAARTGRTMADIVCEAVRMRLDMADIANKLNS